MNGDENRIVYISRVRQLDADLNEMDVNVEDQDIAMSILFGLLDKFENPIVAIDAMTGE